jgi:hypothetical protein
MTFTWFFSSRSLSFIVCSKVWLKIVSTLNIFMFTEWPYTLTYKCSPPVVISIKQYIFMKFEVTKTYKTDFFSNCVETIMTN